MLDTLILYVSVVIYTTAAKELTPCSKQLCLLCLTLASGISMIFTTFCKKL